MKDFVEQKKEQRKPIVVLSWIFWVSTLFFSMLTMIGLSLGAWAITSLIAALTAEYFSQYKKGWIDGYQCAIQNNVEINEPEDVR